VPHVPLHLAVDDPAVVAGLALIRQQQHVPGPFAPEVEEEAAGAATRVLSGLDGDGRRDARDVELVTIDPVGSRDLDQALHIARRAGRGWRVLYAIADVAAFVAPTGALDASCWDRGLTFYLPDGRAPLHPPSLSEGRASLLPGEDRPAVLWCIDLDADGSVVASGVERAVVRSRAQLDYAGVQAQIDAGTALESLMLLKEVGEARQRQEVARGGVSLDLPTQRVEADGGGYRIEFETTIPAMGWNAQVSLLAGMVAAERMADAQVGLLRTMPPAAPWVLDKVRRTARALRVDWPDGAAYAEVVRNLRSDVPDEAALLALAARGLRGAGYLALPPTPAEAAEPAGSAEPPLPPPPSGRANRPPQQAERGRPAGAAKPSAPGRRSAGGVSSEAAGVGEARRGPAAIVMEHAAVAARYAHVTAPLRRLGDRYAAEACLAIEAGERPPDWVTAALPELPAALQRAGGRESGANRAALDLVEALVLRPLVGRQLKVAVVAADDEGSTVVCRDPAVETRIVGTKLPLGDELTVRVVAADPIERKVVLEPS